MATIELAQKAIDDIISASPKTYTEEEALATLRECGILDENNRVADAYKDIIVDKK